MCILTQMHILLKYCQRTLQKMIIGVYKRYIMCEIVSGNGHLFLMHIIEMRISHTPFQYTMHFCYTPSLVITFFLSRLQLTGPISIFWFILVNYYKFDSPDIFNYPCICKKPMNS